MTSFTTQVHVTGSARNMSADHAYLKIITQTVYANHAIVVRDWIEAASSRRKHGVRDEDTDWESILKENTEAIKKSDLVIVEASQLRFSQGFQVYTASRYKKPTLIVTRSPIKDRFISGISSKLISVKNYTSEEELKELVSKFIKKNAIPEKDLRFNMVLDRRIYKYLRDKSYETGKNKSEITRELLEKEINCRNH